MANNRIGLRVTPQDRELLDRVSEARGEDLSDFVRRAIKKELASLSYYPAETKKALGLINSKEGKL
jgi:Protein of unknown function (DUF1778)